MINSLIKLKKFLKFDGGANDAEGTENCRRQKFKIVGMAAHVQDRERHEASTHVKGSSVRK